MVYVPPVIVIVYTPPASGLLWLNVPVPLICIDALMGAPLVSSVTNPVRVPANGVMVGVGVAVPRQSLGGEPLLRGFGAPAVKSVEFWSLSMQPPLARRSAVVFDNPGAGAVPSKQV